ncbi:hypothetical protein CANARDRAFT_204564 [[Candida] arabinofermentans NRRL YB-2248]|uniref:Uncharacterized protein n=1 Tax=[Candida] arabinofermentans NRRL YB-2248 TaxID=983967 RepID=A0A1E4STB7_9ASCO|nr:hypothetical protein CANARDRAFT_204564 [[Candida] arabinofermentans NRRL YB-2248]
MTIARLFKTVSFSSPDTKITTKTLQLVTEYIRLFTSEAILRANEQRIQESRKESNRYNITGGAVDEDGNNQETTEKEDGVLDTKDLEIIAGLLTLDF